MTPTEPTFHGRTIQQWHAYACATEVELEQVKAELRHANERVRQVEAAFPGAVEHVRELEIESLIHAGVAMSNICYNMSQDTWYQNPEQRLRDAKIMRECQVAWDFVLRNFRNAQETKGATS